MVVLGYIFIVFFNVLKLIFLVFILSACIDITMLLTIGYSPNLTSMILKKLRFTKFEKYVRMP
ncbi:hypothetical protein CTN02_10440 [Lysinibacillus sphaericus]|nr:hypothetical protein CTN02_10440 [Lysinibacillus sphaericus]